MKTINTLHDLLEILNSNYTGLVYYSDVNKRIRIYKFPKKSRCAEYHRLYNADRRAKGVCVICGTKAVKNKSKCKRCFDRVNKRRYMLTHGGETIWKKKT